MNNTDPKNVILLVTINLPILPPVSRELNVIHPLLRVEEKLYSLKFSFYYALKLYCDAIKDNVCLSK